MVTLPNLGSVLLIPNRPYSIPKFIRTFSYPTPAPRALLGHQPSGHGVLLGVQRWVQPGVVPNIIHSWSAILSDVRQHVQSSG